MVEYKFFSVRGFSLGCSHFLEEKLHLAKGSIGIILQLFRFLRTQVYGDFSNQFEIRNPVHTSLQVYFKRVAFRIRAFQATISRWFAGIIQ